MGQSRHYFSWNEKEKMISQAGENDICNSISLSGLIYMLNLEFSHFERLAESALRHFVEHVAVKLHQTLL